MSNNATCEGKFHVGQRQPFTADVAGTGALPTLNAEQPAAAAMLRAYRHDASAGDPSDGILSAHAVSRPVVSKAADPSPGTTASGWNDWRRHARTFVTNVGGDLRTCGVVVVRPDHDAVDLDGLDLASLAIVADGVPDAAARGKLVIIGKDGVAVFQTKPGLRPELVWCGNGSAAVPLVSKSPETAFDLFGPQGTVVSVTQTLTGSSVEQIWTLPEFNLVEVDWRGRRALRCEGLNRYAVVLGPLPDGVTPQDARYALAGSGLREKLAIITPSTRGIPHVAFHNAHGLHGAAPASGVATLAVLARLTPFIGDHFSAGSLTYDTKAGRVEVPLPDILFEPSGAISVVMPKVDVHLSALADGSWR